MDERRRTRSLQIGFMVLLGLGTAQLTWWLIDQVIYTGGVRARIEAGYRADSARVSALLAGGTSREMVARLYPDLVMDSAGVRVDPASFERLERERRRRLNRYAWEGGFFLVVLFGAMTVVYRAIRREAELRRRQDGFLAAVSHELKTPLASLRLSAETIAMRDPPPARRNELVSRLLEDLGRLDRMIGNILETSRLSRPGPARVPETLNLRDEVEAVVAETHLLAADGRTTVTIEVPSGLTVRAGQESLRIVLRNLVHNAIRAAPGGQVSVSAVAAGERVRLEVRDDGAGFPPKEAARLFEKFYRLEGDGRTQQTGTGLGLFLVRRYVELDGGSVEAASDGPGRGAVFTVSWPTPIGESG